MNPENRNLFRRMSLANSLWGAPRTHGELLKLGIELSQATVRRYLPWRPNAPSSTWRSFLRNHLTDIAAIDMFVVATATFRLLDALNVLGHDRRKNPPYPGRPKSDTSVAIAPNDRGLSLGQRAPLSASGP